ncbi:MULTISPECIES: chlorohydrolase family protein [Streptomyces]|uniref:Chlorohydrolase family protein n=1 Tax=Streptomyces solicathayae TaxID=3081768 RepID=A0ABZ0M2C1_9ACTN|nr:chlorohydrolase family protein [Streptomyces sp. HUAS YS2]WOX25849.1 chlorohydrolase family protein [Streptomyces sp. HUAS YS2]
MKTLVTASWVIGHDGRSHVEIPDGAVLIDGDTVAEVGARTDLDRRPVDERIDLGDAVLTPGLIDLDALTDIDHLILDSWASPDLADGFVWSAEYFDRPRAVFDAAQRRTVREYALAQLALHGITSYMPIASEVHSDWAETYEDFVATAEVSSRLGLRGFLGPSFRSGVNVIGADGGRTVMFDEEAGRRGLADALRFLDHTEKLADPLLTGVLLPCRIETLTPGLLRDVARAADERGALVRLHALQGNTERAYVQRTYGRTPLQLIADSGLLSDRLIVPHAVVLDVHPDVLGTDTGDVAVLADAGVSVVHCPLTNARYAHNLHTFGGYRAQGVNLCLGTDSFPPDLVRGIDVGTQIAKLQAGDLGQGHLAGYFEALWTGGATALHRPDLGRLAPGAAADLAAFALDDFRMGVTEDPLRTLVLNGTARDAVLTMVAGRVVMRDGEIPGFDLAALRRAGQELFALMRAAYPERDHRGRPVDELFPPVFPRS